VIFASRKWLADFLGVSLRTLARIINDLKRSRVFAVLASRGVAGGTIMIPAWGEEIDEAELARALLREIGEPEEAPSRAGTFKALIAPLRRVLAQLPDGTITILRRVARRGVQMCHGRQIESESNPIPAASLTPATERESEPAPRPEASRPPEPVPQEGLQAEPQPGPSA
jgi:hypothetical protein